MRSKFGLPYIQMATFVYNVKIIIIITTKKEYVKFEKIILKIVNQEILLFMKVVKMIFILIKQIIYVIEIKIMDHIINVVKLI